MTRGQLRNSIRDNLSDAGITYHDDASINEAIQDAYNEVAVESLCITKSATVDQQANKPYYDFVSLGVTDYVGCIAIFNVSTNLWLRDDVTIRNFNGLRRDWELWQGAPQFWAPHSLKYVAIAPNLSVVNTEELLLWYFAMADTLNSDSDTPLVAADKQQLLENYATAVLLENERELMRAEKYWEYYVSDLPSYRRRNLELAKTNLLLRI